ncbi:MAG: hypothetical protein M0Q43_13845, partial [Methanothrix sp.]|nr:hypothetical protein [Methanothrix sp.]
ASADSFRELYPYTGKTDMISQHAKHTAATKPVLIPIIFSPITLNVFFYLNSFRFLILCFRLIFKILSRGQKFWRSPDG